MAIKLIICKDQNEIGEKASKIIIGAIKQKPTSNIGLATGSSPLLTYKKLIADHQQNKTDWSRVTTFNLDEYVGLSGENEHSYRYFMNENLFKHINVNLDNTFIPNGLKSTEEESLRYEKAIREHGGIDLQILGVGTNGHIAFNEPGEPFDAPTHIVNLAESTIKANSRFFNSMDEVPKKAFTMGIGTIMKAKKIILIASGEEKAEAIKHLIDLEQDKMWTCSALQKHPDTTVIVDRSAAKLLKKTIMLRLLNNATYNYK